MWTVGVGTAFVALDLERRKPQDILLKSHNNKITIKNNKVMVLKIKILQKGVNFFSKATEIW